MKETSLAFNEYLKAFDNLNTEDKREQILDSIKELALVFESLMKEEKLPFEYLETQNINDIKTEDEFLKKLMIYIEDTKTIIGQYLEKKM